MNHRMDRPFDAVVIGAGWAGLGVSYVLAKAGLSHRVLERGRIAETWLTQRWDSFYLNTTKSQSLSGARQTSRRKAATPLMTLNGNEPASHFGEAKLASALLMYSF